MIHGEFGCVWGRVTGGAGKDERYHRRDTPGGRAGEFQVHFREELRCRAAGRLGELDHVRGRDGGDPLGRGIHVRRVRRAGA